MSKLYKVLFVVLVVGLILALPSAAFADKKVKDPAPSAESTKTPPGQEKKAEVPPGQEKKEAEPTKEPKKADEPKVSAPEPTPAPESTATPEPESPSGDANKGRTWVLGCKKNPNAHDPKACEGFVVYRSNDARHAGKTVSWRFEPHGGPNAGSGSDSGTFVLDEMGNGSAHFHLDPGMYKLYAKVEGTNGGEKHKVVKCDATDDDSSTEDDDEDVDDDDDTSTDDSSDDESRDSTSARVCFYSAGNAVEVSDRDTEDVMGFVLDPDMFESTVFAEDWDYVCFDVSPGESYIILGWNSSEGHNGPVYRLDIGPDAEGLVEIHNPFVGTVTVEWATVTRVNPPAQAI